MRRTQACLLVDAAKEGSGPEVPEVPENSHSNLPNCLLTGGSFRDSNLCFSRPRTLGIEPPCIEPGESVMGLRAGVAELAAKDFDYFGENWAILTKFKPPAQFPNKYSRTSIHEESIL